MPPSLDSSTPDTETYRRHVEAAAAALRDRVDAVPRTALLLGVGTAPVMESLVPTVTQSYASFPHVPDRMGSTLTVGTFGGAPVIVLDAPPRLCDGYTPREVAFSVRMFAQAGVETVLLTGTAGGLRPELTPGDLMLVTDHINLQGQNPLVGPNVDDWGPRFPDMTEPYDPALRRAAATAAREKGIPLRKGVYLATLGPDLGTQAEARMRRTMGADAVGTGLVPEVIAARHMDMRVAALSVIDALALPGASQLDSERPDASAEGASDQLASLLRALAATDEHASA